MDTLWYQIVHLKEDRLIEKVIVDENDVIIGVVIVGVHAIDLLTELILAVHVGLTAEMVGSVIQPRPTLWKYSRMRMV
jgi:pyruvate/2-oxoglutarate dehydrogenase complex dihydrolipoamide dehydrogenase (E3) component